MDAKICPDGTAVGREGPNCEFAACPEPTAPGEPTQTTFKQYIGTSTEICMRMKYTCDGDEMFADDNGCGCVRKHNNAAVTLCPADYDPVCGWSNASIQCLVYPCASTYSNLCMASIEPTVASTTPGECPPPGSAPGRTYVSTNQTQCAATTWICGAGEQQFYDDTGCGCEPAAKKAAVDCTEPRSQACTKEYMPVCGQKADGTSITAGNKCTACANSNVISYTVGECAPAAPPMPPAGGTKLQATDCTDPRPEICTMDYTPVCAQRGDGTTYTAGNACSACGDKTVLSHVPGECAAPGSVTNQ